VGTLGPSDRLIRSDGGAHAGDRVERYEAEALHGGRETRGARIVQSKIQMIGTRSIDGPVQVVAVEGLHSDGKASAGEIAQEESERHPLPQVRLLFWALLQARQQETVVDAETAHR